ncbi:MAG: hypothetical protein FWB99_01730 [Treponema sp.]|nr:hypothetical protein [Treponema sp.]
MLELENRFYKAHKDEFKKKYPDKWLVIVGESLWGVYDKVSDAGKAALQNFEPGEFMVHRPSDDNMVIEIGPITSVTHSGNGQGEESKPVMTASKGELVS